MKQHGAISQHCSLHHVSPDQPSGPKTEACAVHRAQPVARTVHMSYWITGQSALTCSACQSPACLCEKKIKEGMDKSNLSSTGQPEPRQKAGWGMLPQTQRQQGNVPGRHAVSLNWNLTPQRKSIGIFMNFNIVQKCETSLSPRSSLYWQVEQLHPHLDTKTQSNMAKINAMHSSYRENASICISFKTAPSPFDHGPKEKVF